jgi:hypothetical protein
MSCTSVYSAHASYATCDICNSFFNFLLCFRSYILHITPLPPTQDAPLKEQAGEQDLEYYALFQEYLQVYESTIGEYIESLGSSVEEFYHQLQAVQENAATVKDKKLVHFVNYMIGCTDYPAFYKMMVRAAKKYNKELMADAKAAARANAGSAKAGGEIGTAGLGAQEPADSKGGAAAQHGDYAGGKGVAPGAADSYNSDAKADFK